MVKKNIWLSKSTLLNCFQCPKSLYLQKKFYHYRDPLPPRTKELFKEGRQIEKDARQQVFPGGIDLTPKSPRQWQKVAHTTELLIANKQERIYEAAFVWQGVLCAVDVIEVYEDGSLGLFEIKRGNTLKEVYVLDLAIQFALITSLGYTIKTACITHPEDCQAEELHFISEELTAQCYERKALILEQIQISEKVLSAPQMPNINKGEQCHQPYDCHFNGFCRRQEEHNKL